MFMQATLQPVSGIPTYSHQSMLRDFPCKSCSVWRVFDNGKHPKACLTVLSSGHYVVTFELHATQEALLCKPVFQPQSRRV